MDELVVGQRSRHVLRQIWRSARFVVDEKDYAAVQSKGQQNVREQFASIEALLGDGRDWAVPGAYSVVDPYLPVFYNWGGLIGLDMAVAYPAWRDLTVRTLQRPAVQRVLAKEQVGSAVL